MAGSNFKLFDENKKNMQTDTEYNSDVQRLQGVQTGVASSKLNNKFSYQVSLVAYAITQMMNANGFNAYDYDAVTTFVNNLSSSVLQKVVDKASTSTLPTDLTKWTSPAVVSALITKFTGASDKSKYVDIDHGGFGKNTAYNDPTHAGTEDVAPIFDVNEDGYVYKSVEEMQQWLKFDNIFDNIQSEVYPVGTIISSSYENFPDIMPGNWVECDGSSVELNTDIVQLNRLKYSFNTVSNDVISFSDLQYNVDFSIVASDTCLVLVYKTSNTTIKYLYSFDGINFITKTLSVSSSGGVSPIVYENGYFIFCSVNDYTTSNQILTIYYTNDIEKGFNIKTINSNIGFESSNSFRYPLIKYINNMYVFYGQPRGSNSQKGFLAYYSQTIDGEYSNTGIVSLPDYIYYTLDLDYIDGYYIIFASIEDSSRYRKATFYRSTSISGTYTKVYEGAEYYVNSSFICKIKKINNELYFFSGANSNKGVACIYKTSDGENFDEIVMADSSFSVTTYGYCSTVVNAMGDKYIACYSIDNSTAWYFFVKDGDNYYHYTVRRSSSRVAVDWVRFAWFKNKLYFMSYYSSVNYIQSNDVGYYLPNIKNNNSYSFIRISLE